MLNKKVQDVRFLPFAAKLDIGVRSRCDVVKELFKHAKASTSCILLQNAKASFNKSVILKRYLPALGF